MADPFTDPFAGEDPATGAGNPQSAAAEWTQALARPEVRGTLLQFGINMMQPPGFGQTPMGQFGEAVGASGEYLTRQDEEDRKAREQIRKEADTSSLGNYRADQSENAAERARAATSNAESLGALRNSQVQIAQHKAALIDAQVQNLEMKTKMAPEDQAVKAQLAQARQEQLAARAELDRQRAAYVPVSAENATRRIDATDRKVKADDVRTQARISAQDRHNYDIFVEAHKKREQYSRTKTNPPSFDEWRATRGGTPGATTVPVPAATGPVVLPKDIPAEIERAKQKILEGKDPTTIRQIFKERTGQDLP